MFEIFSSEQKPKPGKKGISEILIGFVNKFYSKANDLKKYHNDALEYIFEADRFHKIVKNWRSPEVFMVDIGYWEAKSRIFLLKTWSL